MHDLFGRRIRRTKSRRSRRVEMVAPEWTAEKQGLYRSGQKDGSWIEYFEDGQIFQRGDYLDGEPNGPWAGYFPSGSPLSGRISTRLRVR